MQIFKAFTFDAAHKLPNIPAGHKCGRIHRHTFRVELHVDGDVDNKKGWVIDFEEIFEVFKPLLGQIDHNYLNEIDGLENPTCENIARWIWNKLKPNLFQLTKVVVQEGQDSGVIYNGD